MKLDAESLEILFPGWSERRCYQEVFGDVVVVLKMRPQKLASLRGPHEMIDAMAQRRLPSRPAMVGRYRMGKWRRP